MRINDLKIENFAESSHNLENNVDRNLDQMKSQQEIDVWRIKRKSKLNLKYVQYWLNYNPPSLTSVFFFYNRKSTLALISFWVISIFFNMYISQGETCFRFFPRKMSL